MDSRVSQGLAWAAGFFDGEGSTSLSAEKRLLVSIGQTDREVLDRFATHVAVGKVTGPYQYQRRVNKTWADIWSYRAYGYTGLLVIEQLWPWLGRVKQEQARAALMGSKPLHPPGMCRKGLHDVTQPGARAPDGRCNVCRKDARSGRNSPNEDLEWIPEFVKV